VLTSVLRAADVASRILPVAAQYALADLAGDAWYRLARRRRRLVAANLGRVLGHLGRDASPGALRRIVRTAFREHARYYLELLRTPRYPPGSIERIVQLANWDELEPVFRAGPVVMVSAHLGNFEPIGHWLAGHGLRSVAPVEEIEPPELYRFLLERRAGAREAVRLVPLSRSARPLLAALRRGETVSLIADRSIDGSGLAVDFFGHRTIVPTGPAMLAIISGAPVVAGRSLRIGPDRFDVRGDPVPHTPTGRRADDVAELTRRVTATLERYIGERPEQWWGAFQPVWHDMRG
jgi:lauroyl/myristoyl acyltransferase